MRHFVNRDNNQLIVGFTYPEAIPDNRVEVKRADTITHDFQYGTPFGVSEEIDADASTVEMVLGFKEVSQYGADYIVSTSAFEKIVSEDEPFTYTYRLTPSYNTDPLNDLLIDGDISDTVADQTARYALTGLAEGTIVKQEDGAKTYWIVIDPDELNSAAGWEPAPQLDYVDLMGELEVTVDGVIFSTLTWSHRVSNDVNKGTEGGPSSGNPSWPNPEDIALKIEVAALFKFNTAVAITSAGNTNLGKSAQVEKHGLHIITAGAGGGAYTRTLALLTADCSIGDVKKIRVDFAASVNPTIEIRNNTSGGPLLFSAMTGDGTAFSWFAEAYFDGTAWQAWSNG